MAPAGFYIGALLALTAVGLIAVFGIAALAVFLIGPRRQGALTAPAVAAALAGLTALFLGAELRLDATPILVITASSAVIVATFQRLRESPRGTTAWQVGFVGGQACIGAAQGLLFGAVASVVGHDARLLWIMIPTAAAIRGVWAFFGRDREARLVGEPSHPPEVVPNVEPAADVEPAVIVAATAETPSAGIGTPLKLLILAVVGLFALAAVAFLSIPGGPDESHVTVFNRTETPVALKSPYGAVSAFVPPCTTVVFETTGQVWVAQSPAPAGSAIPSDAVEVNVDRLIPRGAEAPPPPEWEVLIANDREVGSSPGTWATALPPCAGPARSSIELSGTGTSTTAPFRLAGAYTRSVVVTAPAAGRCSFAATITGGDAPETIVEPFEAAPGTQPRFPASVTYEDGSYELAVTSNCSWSVSFVP